MTELIITEKPNAAKKVAEALGHFKKDNINSVPVYRLKYNGKEVIIACAVGHLYTIGEVEKTPWSKFPVFDIKWVPTSETDKSADYSKKYLNVIKKLAKNADEFTVACDYDIEGEVIGHNIIKLACKANDANRMKFSTLTKKDLLEAYEKKAKTINWGLASAGETRHILDFFYGINLTRALTHSINKATGSFKVLSSGRVQGPALKIIVDREKKIRAFIPVPYWQIELDGVMKGSPIKSLHKEDKFWEKEKADKVMENVSGAKEGKVAKATKKQFKQAPPVPFDLTSMQIEAYRVFKIKPKETLEIAQRLYTGGYISYPRTSSQKLPEQIGYKTILNQLSKQGMYAELASKTLAGKVIPKEGKKTDDAHPAIHPTGNFPTEVSEKDFKIYDLIVKRFFAVFAKAATRETNTLILEVNEEPFILKGTVTIEKGWHEFYAPYVKLDETELPIVKEGDSFDINKIELFSKETKPPNRYTHSSIINALEKKGLGTKATRATIVETLFTRGYVIGDSNIEATELGIRTLETLEKYCKEIVDEELTRHFEDEMELIRNGKKKSNEVLDDAKKILIKIVDSFKGKDDDIGGDLASANKDAVRAQTILGKCPNCKKGELAIRRGKYGKFAGCTAYPECKTIFNLPHNGIIKPSGKVCEICNFPMINYKPPKKSAEDVCINPKCPSKGSETKYPEEGMSCPNCGEGKMIIRRGFYGEFLGCDNYPKCRTMMKIVEGKVDTTPITTNLPPKKKKAAKKTTKKKATKKKTTKRKTVKKKKVVKKN